MRRAGWKTPRAPRGGKLLCRTCGAKVGHNEAWNVTERLFTCTCLACKERAEATRDTGWRTFTTPHGTRYHRELGTGLNLDLELQPTGWAACATRDRQLVGIRIDQPSAAEAARVIEIHAGATAAPLPLEVLP